MADRLADTTVILSLKISIPGNRRKVASGLVEVDADRDAISVSKELLKSPDLARLTALDTELRHWLYARSLPSRTLKGGMYRVPLSTVEEFETYLETYQEKRRECIDRFIDAYPALIEQARETLRDLFDAEDYPIPEVVRRSFGVEYSYLTLDTPKSLSNVSAALLARERAKAIEQARLEVLEIQQAMREELAALLDHAVERLGSETAGKRRGKPRMFKDSLIANMNEFFRTFEGRNVVGDQELAGLVGEAQKILAGTNPNELRKNSTARAVARNSLAAVRTIMDDSLMIKPTRLISFENES